MFLTLLVASCGFHLRGASPLPEVMASTMIKVSATSPLRYELESVLLSAGGEVVEDEETATAILVVHSNRMSRRTLSVDERGRAREYALTLTVSYSLKDASGKTIAKKTTSRVERDYRFDPANVLAKNTEREMVEQEMYRVAAQQMLRHLRRAQSTANTTVVQPRAESSPAPAQ